MNFLTKNIIALTLILISLLINSSLSARPPLPSYNAQYSVFSRDGSQLIYVNSLNNEIIKIQSRSGRIIKRIPFKLKTGATLLAPTPDGFKLLSVDAKGIDVIHNGTGKVLRTLPHPSGRYDWRNMVSQQNNDGTLLAIPSLHSTPPKIYLIHTGTGKIIRQIKLTQRGKIGSIAFSNNKRLLAYTQTNRGKTILHLYDINQQKQQMELAITITGDHYQESIKFNKNNSQLLLSGINQKSVQWINIKNKTIKQLPYPYSSFANFSPDNKSIIILQPHKNTLTIKNLLTQQQQIHRLQSHYSTTIIQSPNKTLLALPILSPKRKQTDNFLWVDTRTGKIL